MRGDGGREGEEEEGGCRGQGCGKWVQKGLAGQKVGGGGGGEQLGGGRGAGASGKVGE
jgi:hypothetical protein